MLLQGMVKWLRTLTIYIWFIWEPTFFRTETPVPRNTQYMYLYPGINRLFRTRVVAFGQINSRIVDLVCNWILTLSKCKKIVMN